jgi:beta-lactamase class D
MRQLAARAAVALFGFCFAGAAGAQPLCLVLADGSSGQILTQEGSCNERLTPASTFKIPLSLMGYDAGFLTDAHQPALPYREGYAATDPAWKTTVDPTSWIKNSVVWYSQQLTTWLGMGRLQYYVSHFKYGNENLAGNPGMNDGLTQCWLDSSLRISPLEQVTFLHRLVTRDLGVSAHAYEMTARITAVPPQIDGWEVYGKSGTGFQMQANDQPNLRRQIGWFVGWAEKGQRSVVFAYALLDDAPESLRAGPRARDALLKRLPALLPGEPR